MLQLHNISKSFGPIEALKNISFTVSPSEIHAICGENGAGKSTLIKILSGVYTHGDFKGEFSWQNKRCEFKNIHEAEQTGIAVIHQELALVKEMSIVENIFLGNELSSFGFLNKTEMLLRAKQLLTQLNLNIDPARSVSSLGIGEQQLVEIAKALNKNARLLILDEPTTALTDKEVGSLMSILRKLKANGVTCIYISHRLEEIFNLCDTITILRDGQFVKTLSVKNTTEQELIELMVGRELKNLYPRINTSSAEAVLEVHDLCLFDPNDSNKKRISEASFSLRKGEVLGIAGLMGAGRTELLNALFGNWAGKKSGTIKLNGKQIQLNTPQDAIQNKIALITEDRKRFGLIVEHATNNNLSLASLKKIDSAGIVNDKVEYARNQQIVEQLQIKVASLNAPVNSMSGGNQQKVVIGKWLLTNANVILLDEPTRGIDVGAKAAIYELINELTKNGISIIMASSDMPEVLGMSDRIMVMSEGRIKTTLDQKDATQELVMKYALPSTN